MVLKAYRKACTAFACIVIVSALFSGCQQTGKHLSVQSTTTDGMASPGSTTSSTQASTPLSDDATENTAASGSENSNSVSVKLMDEDSWKAKLGVYNEVHELWEQVKPQELYDSELPNTNGYSDIMAVKVKTDNPLLKVFMERNWEEGRVEALLGSDFSVMDYYRVYSRMGVWVKSLNNKIQHILFTSAYKPAIANGLAIGSKMQDVTRTLGLPAFKNDKFSVIGYKTEQFYLFFIGKETVREISVYRRDSNYDETALAQTLLSFDKNPDGSNFFHAIRAEWGDFDWEVDAGSQSYIGYNSRGLYCSFNSAAANPKEGLKVMIYNNYVGIIPDNPAIQFRQDKDSIFEHELYRLSTHAQMLEGSIPSSLEKRRVYSGTTFEFGGFLHIMDMKNPTEESELDLGCKITGLQWLNDRYLIYSGREIVGFVDRHPSLDQYGIHIYDADQKKLYQVLTTRKRDELSSQELVSVSGHIFTYRDASGKEHDIQFLFDREGNILLQRINTNSH